jgi:hypothetical protein
MPVLVGFSHLILRVHFDGEIRAAELAHLAAYAKLGPLGKDLPILEDQHLFGAECDTDIAALAIPLPDDMEVILLMFAHTLRSLCLMLSEAQDDVVVEKWLWPAE